MLPCGVMSKTLESPWLTFKAHAIRGTRSEQVASDNRLTHLVAAPLFRAGVLQAGITERSDYCSTGAARPYHDLLLQGRMDYAFGGRSHALAPGQIACCPAGLPFRRSAEARDSWWLHFQIEDLPAWEPIREHGAYVRACDQAALLFLLLRGVLDAGTSHTPAAVAHAWECSRQLAQLLRNEMHATRWERSAHGSALQDLAAAIEADPGRTWDRDAMAASLHLSVRQFSQVFRAGLGVSPHEFVVRQRMNQAVDRLINTDQPIKAIAAEAGYDSLHAFTRLFTRHVGLPPGKYRDRFSHRMDQAPQPRAR